MGRRCVVGRSRDHSSQLAVALALSAAVVSGCAKHGAEDQRPVSGGTPPTTATGATTTTTTSGAAMSGCPMAVAGVTTAVTDVERGVAITITASPEGVAEVRARAHRMGEGGGMMTACPCNMAIADGGMMGGMMHGHMGADAGMHMGAGTPGMMATSRADTRVEDVDRGVRIILLARDANDVPALREHARMHVDHMEAGGCPMMQ